MTHDQSAKAQCLFPIMVAPRGRSTQAEAVTGISRMSIPTPFPIGPVNAYLIEDDPLTLIDTGPNWGSSLVALEESLAKCGRRVEELGRVVLTHQHLDHIGLLEIVARRSKAEICALGRLAPWLNSYPASLEADDGYWRRVMRRHGIPAHIVAVLARGSAVYRAWGSGGTVTHPLNDGSTLEFASRVLQISHRPGHSPSDIVLHDPVSKVLFAGDHLLQHRFSTPTVTRPLLGQSDTSLSTGLEYIASLRATQAMDLTFVLSGHGDPIDDHAALIARRLQAYARWVSRIHDMIERRPATAYQLAREIWPAKAVGRALLTLSEVLGAVGVLVSEGQVAEREGTDGVVRFSLTDG